MEDNTSPSFATVINVVEIGPSLVHYASGGYLVVLAHHNSGSGCKCKVHSHSYTLLPIYGNNIIITEILKLW